MITLALLLSSFLSRADEGMWMINMIDEALQKKMQERGLALSAREIYNADAPGTGLADAVVSLQFSCTGSMISDKGLLITNHHCAYGDVCKLSTPEHNYLEDGFWAMADAEEIPIHGKSVLFLKRVLDVTEEVEQLKDSLRANDIPFGGRKISYLIEKRYDGLDGLSAELASMWAGTKYYLALYKVFDDVRLVAAPPVSIAAYGGEADNWQWPQHKCDFAMYRVYTAPDGSPAEYSEENVPLHPEKTLKISLDGYQKGDYTMVIGYPGRTDRYSCSAKIEYEQNVSLPISNEARGERMQIINRWMNADPEIRLKYSDYYFSLGNVQELNEWKSQCFKRFSVADKKRKTETELQEWLLENAEQTCFAQSDLISNLKSHYEDYSRLEQHNLWFRETCIIGTQVATIATKLKFKNINPDAEEFSKLYSDLDMRVERDLFRYCVEAYYKNADTAHFGPFQKAVLEEFSDKEGRTDFDALTARLWDSSCLTDPERLVKMAEVETEREAYTTDSLYMFFADVSWGDLNREVSDAMGETSLMQLETRYKHSLYQMREERGDLQYPDANSTMRLTYGQVCELEPWDGVLKSWHSTTKGVLEKFDPEDYEFNMDAKQRELVSQKDFGRWWDASKEGVEDMFVNFLTDNDITGGNSGSPVLNSRGELIGLAFDGNPESLASDAYYTPGYNKCVCVDIRYILFTLDRYAGMTRIIEELGL